MSKAKIDIHESSLDNSADVEYLDMVDEGSYESAEDRSNLVSQSFLDTEDDTGTSYNFKEISSTVAYRFVPMSGVEETISNQTSGSPTHVLPSGEFYVIANNGEIYNPPTSGQKKASRKESMPAKVITTKRRDDKRRATHNEVERRRRDKINSWITRLAALVPDAGQPDSASKGGILAKACDYITHLTDKHNRSEKLEMENQKLIKEVIRLSQELSECRKQNDSLRSQVIENCLVPQWPKKEQS